jgi:hypothetical protein
MIEGTATSQTPQSMTSQKILTAAYTRAISETFSRMPLNQTLLRADIRENVSDIPDGYQGRGIFSGGARFGQGCGEWWLSRANNSLEGTSREQARKVGAVSKRDAPQQFR